MHADLLRVTARVAPCRFNQSRYDAEAVIAEFTVGLRGTVDLEAVRDDLTGVVHQAFEPAHVTVSSAVQPRA